MKRIKILICCMILGLCLTGCTLWPVYYEESTITEAAKEVVGEEVEYISLKKDKDNQRVIYTYADDKEREFTFTAYAEHPDFIDGASLPGYQCELQDSYLKSIFMHHKEEIDEILYQTIEENGWELDRYDCPVETEETSKVSLPVMDSPVFIMIDSMAGSAQAQDEDMRQLARMGVQIDQILCYEYDYTAVTNEDIIYRGDDECTIILVFESKDMPSNRVSFDFSISEETRWTEESLYEYLRQKYEKNL
ncbi:MAG: hypothetical protein IJ379_11560 [Lachnospiraceae bacterium]|nr:hypothetical protein [Lachnospiraceae bacterium]